MPSGDASSARNIGDCCDQFVRAADRRAVDGAQLAVVQADQLHQRPRADVGLVEQGVDGTDAPVRDDDAGERAVRQMRTSAPPPCATGAGSDPTRDGLLTKASCWLAAVLQRVARSSRCRLTLVPTASGTVDCTIRPWLSASSMSRLMSARATARSRQVVQVEFRRIGLPGADQDAQRLVQFEKLPVDLAAGN